MPHGRIDWSLRSAPPCSGAISHRSYYCTRLNADSIDDFASIFRRLHLRPVNLDRAMRDRAYRTPDTYVGEDGIDWLERWSALKRTDLHEEGEEDPPTDI